MDPERTTTIGEGEEESSERDFQSMNADDRMREKVRSWVRTWRGEGIERVENIASSFGSFLCMLWAGGGVGVGGR